MEDLAEAKASNMILPVLLADASQGHGVFAWGEASSIEQTKTGTRITLRKVRPVPFHPYVWSFRLSETGEFISQNDQRSYRRIVTPEFLIRQPRVFLLTWNPDESIPVQEIRKSVEPTRKHTIQMESPWSWRCYSTNLAGPGDRFYLLRQGRLPRGIVASGWIRSGSFSDEDGTPHVKLWVDKIIDPDQPLPTSRISGAEKIGDNVFKSGHRQVESALQDFVESAWNRHCESEGSPGQQANKIKPQLLKREKHSIVEDASSSLEGRLIESTSNRRERKRENRERCLANYDRQRPPCVVCGMNFYDEYGLIGCGFIHVHHTKPAAVFDAGGEELVPSKDLVPVCPNCHAMLHAGMDATKGEVRSVLQLRKLRSDARRSNSR